jgi:hypothetical protein
MYHYFSRSSVANDTTILQSSVLKPVCHFPEATMTLLFYLDFHLLANPNTTVHNQLMLTRGADFLHLDVIGILNYFRLHAKPPSNSI